MPKNNTNLSRTEYLRLKGDVYNLLAHFLKDKAVPIVDKDQVIKSARILLSILEEIGQKDSEKKNR